MNASDDCLINLQIDQRIQFITLQKQRQGEIVGTCYYDTRNHFRDLVRKITQIDQNLSHDLVLNSIIEYDTFEMADCYSITIFLYNSNTETK